MYGKDGNSDTEERFALCTPRFSLIRGRQDNLFLQEPDGTKCFVGKSSNFEEEERPCACHNENAAFCFSKKVDIPTGFMVVCDSNVDQAEEGDYCKSGEGINVSVCHEADENLMNDEELTNILQAYSSYLQKIHSSRNTRAMAAARSPKEEALSSPDAPRVFSFLVLKNRAVASYAPPSNHSLIRVRWPYLSSNAIRRVCKTRTKLK